MFRILLFLALAVSPLRAQSLEGQWQWDGRLLSNGEHYRVVLKVTGQADHITGQIIFPSHAREVRSSRWQGSHFTLYNAAGKAILEGDREPAGKLHLTVLEGKALDATASPAQGYVPSGSVPAVEMPKPNGLAQTPPMGWNSWNHFQEAVDDRSVREMADAMVASGMRDAGYQYVNIDDTWEGVRDSRGFLQPNSKFPDMKALADYVHQRGLKLGLYSSPGPLTCAGYPGSLGHEQQDAATFAQWGIDYLKYDWCSARYVYRPGDMKAVYTLMGAALAKGPHPIVYSLCQYGEEDVQEWAPAAAANLWRTTQDIHDHWGSMIGIALAQAKFQHASGPGHWNDPDMLEVGNGGMSTEEYQVHLTLWSMLNAPLLAGNDLRTMSPETRSLLLNPAMIAIDQQGSDDHVVSDHTDAQELLWTRHLKNGDLAVAYVNLTDKPRTVTLDAAALAHHKVMTVRNVWTGQMELLDSKRSLTRQVAPHSTLFVRMT